MGDLVGEVFQGKGSVILCHHLPPERFSKATRAISGLNIGRDEIVRVRRPEKEPAVLSLLMSFLLGAAIPAVGWWALP
jgi:hypothetical protein